MLRLTQRIVRGGSIVRHPQLQTAFTKRAVWPALTARVAGMCGARSTHIGCVNVYDRICILTSSYPQRQPHPSPDEPPCPPFPVRAAHHFGTAPGASTGTGDKDKDKATPKPKETKVWLSLVPEAVGRYCVRAIAKLGRPAISRTFCSGI